MYPRLVSVSRFFKPSRFHPAPYLLRNFSSSSSSSSLPPPSSSVSSNSQTLAALRERLALESPTLTDFIDLKSRESYSVEVGTKKNPKPKPKWMKEAVPGGSKYTAIKSKLRELKLHTVCEEAKCPNLAECWSGGETGTATATIMILGDTCTRGCRLSQEQMQLSVCATTTAPLSVTQAKRKRLQLPQVTWKYAQLKPDEVGNDFSIYGYITEVSFKRDPWYTSCSNCFKKVSADENNHQCCPKCMTINPPTKLRYILRAKISDWTDTVATTIFDVAANQALRITAQDLSELSQDILLVQHEIESRLKDPFIFEIKRTTTASQQHGSNQFIANYIERADFP